jgi:hypothetical protein
MTAKIFFQQPVKPCPDEKQEQAHRSTALTALSLPKGGTKSVP